MFFDLCKDSRILNVFLLIKQLIQIMGIIIPLICILFITIDLIKLIVDPSDKNAKILNDSIISKGLALVFFFLLPIIVNLVTGLFNYKYQNSSCLMNANTESIRLAKYREEANKKVNYEERVKYMEDLAEKKANQKEFLKAKAEEKQANYKALLENKDKSNINEQIEKKRRNDAYYQSSFPDLSRATLTEEDLIELQKKCGDNCFEHGFWARYTKPVKGDKFFPELGSNLLGQCVWYAKGRAQEIIATSNLPTNEKEWRINAINNTYGNGQDWNYNNPGLRSFKSGSVPKPGSIVAWSRGQYGHVGIIEGLEGTNIIMTDGERKTYGGAWRYGPYWEDVIFRRNSYTVSGLNSWAGILIGFVYLLD